jgi:hypothetical protein
MTALAPWGEAFSSGENSRGDTKPLQGNPLNFREGRSAMPFRIAGRGQSAFSNTGGHTLFHGIALTDPIPSPLTAGGA